MTKLIYFKKYLSKLVSGYHFENITKTSNNIHFLIVFRIHDILVWIWIRIHGSMPLTNGSGSGSCYFRH
jgi:hypothetical protein